MFSTLVSLALCVGFFVMLPLLIVGAAVKLLLALILLPLKLLGGLLKLVIGLVTGVIAAAGALGFALVAVLLLVALPLLPLLLLGGFVWAVIKAFAPGPALVTL
jgi:hypothetical protein